jgi:glycine hydroxymethyltransferase
MAPEFKQYAQQVVKNSIALADAIKSRGYRLVSGGTDNHMMLVDVAASGLTGKDAAAVLDAAGIIVNKNTIPYDKNSPFVTSGIRIGTASVTTRGMKEEEMGFIGNKIADVLENMDDSELHLKIREEVVAFARKFMVP